ncbi:MAG: DUF1778 domain-containing protein [Dehalococcoidia bacterium]|nr:DUF1778 domain-containing protein [Dehalococcoidia bacterium]
MSTFTKKTERFEQRSTSAVRDLIERAADLSGRSVSDFIISSAEAAARETVHTYQVIQMTTAGTANFVQAFLNPPSSSERMEVEARRYMELVDRA